MKVCALAGGVGGAKLASGLQDVLPPGDLSVVVNTADDFDLWGLHICPDLDTVMYTLAGISNPETGWGIVGGSFETLNMVESYGEENRFKLGDREPATHILRTFRMGSGETLTQATVGLSGALGVESAVLPMSDDTISTILDTPEGRLEFQEYFVRRGQSDEVLGIELRGIDDAGPTERVLEAISRADAIVFCPSNPVVSVGPILALPGLVEALASSPAPKVAVSPIVGGRALKGPADRMLASLGHEVSATGVARMYEGWIDGFVVDQADGEEARISSLGMRVLATDAVMHAEADRERLGREVLEFCSELGIA